MALRFLRDGTFTGSVSANSYASTTDAGININGITLSRVAANSAIRVADGLETLGLLRSYAGLVVGTSATIGSSTQGNTLTISSSQGSRNTRFLSAGNGGYVQYESANDGIYGYIGSGSHLLSPVVNDNDFVARAQGEFVVSLGATEKLRIASNQITAKVDVLELSNDFSIQSTDGNYWQRIITADATSTTTNTFSFDVRAGSGSFVPLLSLRQDGIVIVPQTLNVNGAGTSTFEGNVSLGPGGTGTTDCVLSIDGGSGTGGEAYLRLMRGGTSGFILNHTATAIQVRATANIPMFFYTNDTLSLKINANNTISLPTYGAGYLKTDGSGNVTADSSAPGTGVFLPLAGGTMTGTGFVQFPDNFDLYLGSATNGDFQAYHDGSNTYLRNLTGDFYIRQDRVDASMIFQCDDGAGGLETYFQLEGASGGASPFTVFPDSSTLAFGTGHDFRLYHNGSSNYQENYTGNIYISNYANDSNIQFSSDNGSGGIAAYILLNGSTGSVVLSHYGSTKLETTSTGVTVTGSAGILIEGTNSTGAESILVQGFASTDTLGSIRTANTGGYNQQMRFYTSDVIGQPENLTLTLTSTQNAVFAGDVSLANLKSIYLGTSSALRIYTDSATAYLRGDDVRLTNAANDSIVRVNGDVAELYYNDLKKFETTSTGVSVTGDVLIDSGEYLSWGTAGATSIEGSTASNKLQFRTSSTDRMIINDTGVGIGTTSPSSKLEVVGNGGTILDIQGSQGQLFSVTDSLSGDIFAVADISGVPIFTVNSSSISYFDGKVGIGESSPDGLLHIHQTGSGTSNSIITEDDARKIFIGRDSIKATDLSNNAAMLYLQQHGGNATFGNDVIANGNIKINTGSHLFFDGGTNATYISEDVADRLRFFVGGAEFMRFTESTADTVNIFKNTTFGGKATSLATAASDGSTTLTTKSYVDGLVTGVPVYKGTWAAGTTGVTSAAINGTTITLTAAPTETIAIGDVVTADGIIAATTVTAVASQTSVTVSATVVIANTVTVTFSSEGGYPDLTLAAAKVLGNYYIVSTAGNAAPNGSGVEPDSWAVGDWCIFSDVTPGAGTDLWQRIDNSSVISGAGTGGTIPLWEGATNAVSETLTDSPITVSGNNSTFAGNITTETGGSVFGGSGGIPIYARSTGTVSYMQFQTSSTGSNGSSDGLTVGVNGSTAYIWNRENTTLHLGTNDTSALALDNSQNATFAGNVGVSVSPTAKLHIQGTNSANGAIKIQNSGGNPYAIYSDNNDLLFTNGNGSTTALTIAYSGNATFAGNVGIGMTAGTIPTEIEGRASDGKSLRLWDNAGTDILDLYNNGTNAYINTTHSGGAGNPLIIQTNSITALTLDTSQNATFAGKILAGTGASAAATINAYTTTVSTNLFSALRIIENSAASTYWDIGATGGASPDLKFFVNAGTTPKLTLSTSGNATFAGNVNASNANLTGALNINNTLPTIKLTDTDTSAYGRIRSSNGSLTLEADEGNTQADSFIKFEIDAGEKMRISSAGAIKFNAYDSTNNTGTPTYVLGTDASGNVVKVLGGDIPGGGGTVTGTGSATQVAFWDTTSSLSGSNNLYWDSTNNYLGIGDATPNSKLKVTGGTSETSIYTVDINHVRNDANVATHAMRLNVDLSGADTTTADRTNSGLYLDIDSSANGDASNEHRIHGVNSNINFTGFSDIVRGGYFLAESNYTSGKTAQLVGVYGYAIHDANDAAGGVSNMYGVYGISSIQDTGDVDNALGVYGLVTIGDNRVADVGVTKAVEGEITIDKSTALNYGTMIGVSSVIDNNEGSVPNFGSQYLFKGDYQGTKGGNAYGIYTEGDKHYFGGNIGIGATNPASRLSVGENGITTKIATVTIGDTTDGASLTLRGGSPTIYFDRSGADPQNKILMDSAGLEFKTGTLDAEGDVDFKINPNGDLSLAKGAKISNQENTDIDSAAAEVVAEVDISYTAAFFDFVVKKGTNVRSGTVYACHDGTNVEFTETSTNDLGDTSDVTLSVDKTSTKLRLLATVTSDAWSVKSLIRAI